MWILPRSHALNFPRSPCIPRSICLQMVNRPLFFCQDGSVCSANPVHCYKEPAWGDRGVKGSAQATSTVSGERWRRAKRSARQHCERCDYVLSLRVSLGLWIGCTLVRGHRAALNCFVGAKHTRVRVRVAFARAVLQVGHLGSRRITHALHTHAVEP